MICGKHVRTPSLKNIKGGGGMLVAGCGVCLQVQGAAFMVTPSFSILLCPSFIALPNAFIDVSAAVYYLDDMVL